MRLSSPEPIAAAVDAGITVFDTARAYGDNERLLAGALDERARIVTKGGMARVGGAWVPDGRAKTIVADCEASLVALNGLPIDTYLVHAPDPRTPWPTTVRALDRLLDDGLVRRIGLSNVNRRQLDEALDLAPIAAVEVALSVFDERTLRGGIVERCEELGIALIAHSPLGGARRRRGLARRPELVDVARAHGATPAEAAIAWLLALAPHIIPIPGATRPETARSVARAARLEVSFAAPSRRPASRRSREGEVVIVMGIPGAGKSRIASEYSARGYVRLNRDVRGGGLRELAGALDDELAAGARRVVLDNTYLSRASRSYVLDAAARHGIPVRCVWLSTPLAQAQVNLVERLLEQFGTLPMPEELRRGAPGVLAPTSQMRAQRELEPPSEDEGFAAVDVVAFAREPAAGRTGVFVAAAALRRPGWERTLDIADKDAPHLVFDWSPGGDPQTLKPCAAQLAAAVPGPISTALCPHGAGPPSCWCRPPLPGLPLVFARAHAVDPARSILIGTGPAHRNLAAALGAGYVAVP
jgi:aryl-alcohol dehydrogenase-like predicted oxidoreductase/predicted kinase